MIYLVDTNVWLERLLNQDKSTEVGKFLDFIPAQELAISDFSLHSIGIILDRLGKLDAFEVFVDDLITNGNVLFVNLQPEKTKDIVVVVKEYGLDFDDAYQIVASKELNASLVSYDSDFDKTNLKRVTPEEVIRLRKVSS